MAKHKLVSGIGSGMFGAAILICQGVLMAAPAQLTVGSAQIQAGNTGTVSVSLANNGSAVAGMQFDLQFDPSLTVTASAGASTTAAGKSLSQSNQPDGTKRYLIVGFNTTLIGDGSVVELSIKVDPNVTSGEHKLKLLNLSATDSAAKNTDVTGVDGVITVTGGTPPAALTITKVHSGSFTSGQSGTYTVTVKNGVAAAPAAGTVTVTDTVPAGLAISSMSGAGWTCPGNFPNNCTRSDGLAAGETYPPIVVVVNVAGGATSPQANTATVSGGGSASASATDSTNIEPPPPPNPAVLSIVKIHSGDFTQGQQGTYAVTVKNAVAAGPTTGTVVVTDALPTGLTFVSMGGAGWTCPGTAPNNCTRTDVLSPGASYPAITVTVNVAPNATSPQVNSVSVTGGGSVSAATTDSTKIGTVPVLSISKTHAGDFTQAQKGATYRVIVGNGLVGAGATNGAVVVSETVPAGLTLVSMAGTGWTCPGTAPNNCTRNDSLPGGSGYPDILVTVDVAADANSPQVNAVSVSGGGSASASATNTTNIVPLLKPALTLTKTHSGDFLQGQTDGSYTVIVRNTGTGPTIGTVTVGDTLPIGLSLTSIAGSGWNCPGAASNVCTRTDTLGPGASYPPIALTVNVARDAPVGVTNIATISGGGAPDNRATDPTIVTLGPLAILLGSLNLNPGNAGVLPVALTAPGAASVPVTLNSSDASILSLSAAPGTATAIVVIAAGQKDSTLTVVAGKTGLATLTATAPGFAPASAVVQVGDATGTMIFSPNSADIVVPGSQNLILTLASPAPLGGLSVTLTSTPNTVATVPPAVTVFANSTSVTVPVTAIAPGSATITARAAGYSPATAAVTVASGLPQITLSPIKLNPGNSGILPVALSLPAPADGVFITLSSSDASIVSLSTAKLANTANLVVPALQSSSSRLKVAAGQTGVATITAKAPGYQTGTVQVIVGAPAPAINLDFAEDGLSPAAQGLSYATESATPEASAYSSGGGLYHLDTFGLAASAQGGYSRSALYDSTRDVALSTSLKIYPGTKSVGFTISDAAKSIGISFSDSGLALTAGDMNAFIAFDTTDGPHSYVFTSPGSSGAYSLLIDGVVKASGVLPLTSSPGAVGVLSIGQFNGPAKADFVYIHYAN